MIDCFLGDAFGVLSCQFGVLFCSVVLLQLLHSAVSSVSFLTMGVFECDLVRRQSVSVLCMQYKIRCNPMHPLYGALPVPDVPVRVTRGAVITNRYTYAPPRCRTSQHREVLRGSAAVVLAQGLARGVSP